MPDEDIQELMIDDSTFKYMLDSKATTYSETKNIKKDFCHDGIYRLGGPCPVCQRQFQTASGIAHHMLNKHPNY